MTACDKQEKKSDERGYRQFSVGIHAVLENARRAAGRAVNSVLTANYWEIGRRIVEFEQKGEERAEYGAGVLQKLSIDLTKRFGRGFSERNLQQMRTFYTMWPTPGMISFGSCDSGQPNFLPEESVSYEKPQTLSAESIIINLSECFPLPWPGYVKLMSVENERARQFYENEAFKGGWSVRQLSRQISSKFFERTLLSRNKAAMLKKGRIPENGDALSPEEEIKDPYILEFLDLKDEYSENDLEEALIKHLETFLLELGGDFAFIARQKRMRIGNKWYRVDLVFFHRKLRCLIMIDLKLGEFSHADAGQMHLYCNYAAEHWTKDNENPPVGLILCAGKDKAVAKYALEGLSNKILAAEYKMVLPNETDLVEELKKTQRLLETRTDLLKGKS